MDLVDWGGVGTLLVVLVGVVVFFTVLFATMRLFAIADDLKAIRRHLEGGAQPQAEKATTAAASSPLTPPLTR